MKNLKKTVVGVITAVLLLGVLSGTVLAYNWTGRVKVATSLNVRKSYSAGSTVIGRLYNGNQINILDNYNGWYKVPYNGSTGWVSAAYVALPDRAAMVQTAITTAKSMMGVRYVFGAASPTAGFDCSGLTMYAYSKAGIKLAHSSSLQATAGAAVSRANLIPGDLIFFDTDGGLNNITHVGIYIGDSKFIQAQSGSAQKVTEASLTNSYWSSVYMTARRIVQ